MLLAAWELQSNRKVSSVEQSEFKYVFMHLFEIQGEHIPLTKLRPHILFLNPLWQRELGSDQTCLQEALHLPKWKDKGPICGLNKTP